MISGGMYEVYEIQSDTKGREEKKEAERMMRRRRSRRQGTTKV